MWPPPNMQSFPSKEEVQRSKEEISTIELEIIETELRLDALRKSLFERKAWISPIRMIPPEILSLIFIEASRTDWKAPLLLQSVSRLWRDVAMDSSAVWSFIPLSGYSSSRHSKLTSLFLERSRNAPLHISVGENTPIGYMKPLEDRITCIHLGTNCLLLNRYLQSDHAFHRLERLNIDTWGMDSAVTGESLHTDDLMAWDMLLFPNLKALDIGSRSTSLLRAISAAPEVPAIRHLTINCSGPERLADILTKCATSLESVDLTFNNWQSDEPDTEHEVYFPHLKYLRLLDYSLDDEPRFHFKAATPNLQAHLDEGRISTLNSLKVDTGNIILLHFLRTPDLFQYPRIVTLCFSALHGQDEELIRALEWLSDEPAICPDLALIEHTGKLTQGQLERVSLALLAREKATWQTIQLMKGAFRMQDRHAQKKRVQMFREVEVCGHH